MAGMTNHAPALGSTDAPVDDGLFPHPAIVAGGSAVASMRTQIEQWQASGKALSIVVRQMLLDQCAAVDMARTAGRATAISGASKVLLELLVGFHLVDDAPPPVDDPLAAFLAAVDGDSDG